MLNSQNSIGLPIDPLDATGGEPLVGSGFENEEPEQGFDFEPNSSEEVD